MLDLNRSTPDASAQAFGTTLMLLHPDRDMMERVVLDLDPHCHLWVAFVLAPTLPVAEHEAYLRILAYLRDLALGWVADTLYVLSPDLISAEVQRLLLAHDARSLLSTPEFQEYVERLLAQDIWENSQLRTIKWTELHPSTWLMTLLEFPVKLKTFDNAPGIPHEMAMNVEFGRWNTDLRILLVTREDDKPNYPKAQNIGQQWLNVSTCLKREIESSCLSFLILPSLKLAKQAQLAMKLMSLIAYTCELFSFPSTAVGSNDLQR